MYTVIARDIHIDILHGLLSYDITQFLNGHGRFQSSSIQDEQGPRTPVAITAATTLRTTSTFYAVRSGPTRDSPPPRTFGGTPLRVQELAVIVQKQCPRNWATHAGYPVLYGGKHRNREGKTR